MKTEVVAGIDIGGTNAEIGLVDKSGQLVFSERLSTKAYPRAEDFVKDASRVLREGVLLANAELLGIGIGAPSANYFSGSIEYAPNMPWEGIVPLAGMLEKETGIKCTLTNDANAAALGELLFGDAKFLSDFVVVTLGTGLGSGFVVGGEVLYGHDGFAGELGHVIIEQNGRLCGCGRKGCLETYVSATGIVNTAKEWLELKEENTALKNIPAAALSSKLISDAALDGDAFAIRLIEYTAEKLGFALANMVTITSPSHIFLYGGLAKAGDILLKPAKKFMEQYMLRNFKGKVQLQLSGLPENAAVLGAAALGWKEAER